MLLTTGCVGAARSTRPAFAQRSAAGFIRLEWNGADTGSGSARLAPAAFSTSQAFSTRGLAAGDHGLLRVVEVHGLDTTSPLAAAPPRHSRPSRLRHPGPGWRPWRLAHRHRLLHGLGAQAHQGQRPAASVSAPAATSALYSPSEWPATAAGTTPVSASQAR
jgi:hypothetical protein